MNNPKQYRYKPLCTVSWYDDKMEQYVINMGGVTTMYVSPEVFERDFEEVSDDTVYLKFTSTGIVDEHTCRED